MVIPKIPFSLVSLVCKIFLSDIVQGDKILWQQRRWSLACIGPVNTNSRAQIEIIIEKGEMFAYQYPTYLRADASISAAPAELWRLVLAIPRGPSTADFRADFFKLWVPNFF